MAGKKSKSNGILEKVGATIPTKKSMMSQLKGSAKDIGAGALTGAGEVLGEAALGDVVGPVVGGIGSSLVVKDPVAKKFAIMMGARKSARNMLI